MSREREGRTRTDAGSRFCFTGREFFALAGSLGIRQLYGFRPDEPSGQGEKELHRLLFEMTAKRFLEPSGQDFVVVPEIREIFEFLKSADCVIAIQPADNSFPAKCIYPGEKAVLVEAGGLQGKYFKCCCGPHKEILETAFESGGLLPGNTADDLLYHAKPVSAESLDDEELGKLCGLLQPIDCVPEMKKLSEYGVRTVMEKREIGSGGLLGRIFLAERPVYDALVVQEETLEIFQYSRQLVTELVQNWMETPAARGEEEGEKR